MHSVKARLAFALAVVLSAILWFGMLGYRDLTDPDEGRYAQIPAGMVQTGDWITPRLNDIKYFEKPVLQYWATAAIYTLFGESNATARLWTALTGFALVLVASYAALSLFGSAAAVFTFATALSSLMMVLFGHLLTLDMSFSFFLVSAICSLVVAQQEGNSPGRRWRWMMGAWACLSLALLTKGLVAVVLAGGTVVIYSLWQRDWRLWLRLHLFEGLALFIMIAAPWFILVSQYNPGFAEFFFIHEHFDRYTSTVHRREGPVYYFLPFLVLGVGPWVLSGIRALLNPGFDWRPARTGVFEPDRFLWTFSVFTLVFFSLGQSKLPGYILPVIPVLAILAGRRLSLVQKPGWDKWGMALFGLFILVSSLLLQNLANDRYPVEQWNAFAPWVVAGGVMFVLGAVILSISRNKPLRGHVIAALLCLAAAQSLILGFQSLSESRSGRIVADVIMETVPENTPVFSVQSLSESSAFYLQRPQVLVGYAGEMKMGIKMEPEKQIPDMRTFFQTWDKLDNAVAIVHANKFSERDLERLGGRIVYKGPKRMVVVKS